ncbi:hypothetical protein QGP82_00660 [Leptothoe sp. LEGE 181152]|nr:hypothetical protein [Leptothoe sp. LEGE 181152]
MWVLADGHHGKVSVFDLPTINVIRPRLVNRDAGTGVVRIAFWLLLIRLELGLVLRDRNPRKQLRGD